MRSKRSKILAVALPFIVVILVHLIVLFILVINPNQSQLNTQNNSSNIGDIGLMAYMFVMAVHGPTITFGTIITVILLEIVIVLIGNGIHKGDEDYCWYCEYCGKEYETKKDCDRHEKECRSKKSK